MTRAGFAWIGDLNGDGKPDLVLGNGNNIDGSVGSVSVLLGYGDGTFQSAVSYSSGAYGADSIMIGDMNGDGHPDLVVANQCQSASCDNPTSDGEIGVLLGNSDGTFQPAVTYGSGGSYAA